MTAAGVAVAVVAFVLLRTIIVAWNAGADYAAKDRLSTRNSVSFGLPLPKKYIDDIRRVPGEEARRPGGRSDDAPVFRVTPATAVMAFGATLLIGAGSAAIPAFLIGRLSVTDALRRVV